MRRTIAPVGMRIVLTSLYAWPEVRRGGERYVHELGGALAEAGHDVRILATGPAPARSEVRGVPVRLLRRRGDRAFAAQAFARLAANRFDVWHASTTPDGAAAAVLGSLRGIRSVFTDHGFPARASRERRDDHRLHEVVVRRADAYVCVSEAAGEHLRADYGREPVVCSGGVDLRRFAPARREPVPTLLFCGDANESRKGLPLLLDALRILRGGDGGDVRLWVAGPGDQMVAATHDGVETLGVVDPDALADRYARAWATVLPARAEAFGLVLVESLASGTPVVALDEGGPREIVAHAPGRLARPDDPEDLARACAEAIELAADPATAAACRDAARRWDWREAIVPRMEAVYAA